MTFEHGRIKTWRLPRFSAFEMDLRQSARTCVRGTGEGSVLVSFYVCVLHRELCGGGRACCHLVTAAQLGNERSELRRLGLVERECLC